MSVLQSTKHELIDIDISLFLSLSAETEARAVPELFASLLKNQRPYDRLRPTQREGQHTLSKHDTRPIAP